ncbi:hypothetical protein BCV08_15835 [Vibrio breoganii]|nr:hypothetical protein BCV08_15835 [Vibrio breoganii]
MNQDEVDKYISVANSCANELLAHLNKDKPITSIELTNEISAKNEMSHLFLDERDDTRKSKLATKESKIAKLNIKTKNGYQVSVWN